jgi:hypothetical protein
VEPEVVDNVIHRGYVFYSGNMMQADKRFVIAYVLQRTERGKGQVYPLPAPADYSITRLAHPSAQQLEEEWLCKSA